MKNAAEAGGLRGMVVAGKGSTALAKVGLGALSVAPLAVVAKFWPTIARHPVAALLLLLVYEALIVSAAFAGKVFEDLRSRWSKRVADAIDRRVLWRTSRFERDYRAAMVSRHRFVDLKGLATRGDFTPGLEEIFVDVSLAPRPAHETSGDPLAGTPRAEAASTGAAPVRRSIEDFIGGPEGAALAVIGAPGTGKTTLVKHLALHLAQRRRRARRDLPVLLLLRDHASIVRERPSVTLSEIIRGSLRGLQEPTGFFEQRLQDGRCVVLLDGLDEVAREDDRRAVATWVEEQIERYERNDFVLTSRPYGYLSAPLNRAQVLQVRRFTGGQISRFVHGWYRTIEKLSTGVDDTGVEERAAEEAEDLLARLRARPVLYDLAANPLLLTMIANVHRYRGALPGSRADLYREICEVLLWRRHQAKNPTDAEAEVSGAKKEIVLRELAYRMMAARLRDIDTDRAAKFLRSALVRVAQPAPTETTEVFLTAITASGLLVERERGLYAFAHLTLQEHLAALYLQHHRMPEVLAAAVDDDWWRETTLLYASRVDPAPIVEACLESQTTTALALAFDCADAATEFAADTARRLEALRQETLTEPAGSVRRRLMTAVTLTRRLRETVHLGDNTLVCARPVTREIYELFAADRPGSRRSPIGEGSPEETAVGMTRYEARAFVGWVNALLPDGSDWRLPTEAEVHDPAFRLVAHNAIHTVWHTPGTDSAALPALWAPEGTPHPWSTRLHGDIEDGLGTDSTTILFIGQLGLLSVGYHILSLRLSRPHPRRRDPALTRDLAYARDLARGLARTRDSDLARARDLARALIRHPDPDPAIARDLGGTLARARDRALTRARARDLDRDSALNLTLNLDRDSARTRARDLDRALAYAIDLARHPALARVDALARVAAWVIAGLSLLAGPRSWLDSSRTASTQEHIMRPLRGDWGTYVVLPEDLNTAAEAATEQMINYAGSSTESSALRRIGAQLARETASLLTSFLSASGGPDHLDAACLQLATRTLAAIADQELRDQGIAELYRTVSAGVTVLQHRADGTITPSETVILARA